MTKKRNIHNDYFDWLCSKIHGVEYYYNSYRYLLSELHNIEFYWILPNDSNRAQDGVDLRSRFCYENDIPEEFGMRELDGRCSFFEMLVALAIRCEEQIMGDPLKNDQTDKWFWLMIRNMGLIEMDDARFDLGVVHYSVRNVLERRFEPNGRGGLFILPFCDGKDLRYIEIWYQMMLYLDNLI